MLKECLESIQRQTFSDWECIVIDDGSKDDSALVATSFAQQDPRFILLCKENGGTASARNAGMRVARGEWIAFLDSDDLYYEHTLELYEQLIQANPGVKIVGAAASSAICEAAGISAGAQAKGSLIDAFFYQLSFVIGGPELLPSCSCIDRAVMEEIGLYLECYEALEDTEFWIRATALNPVFYLGVPVTRYRRGQGGEEGSKQDAVIADGRRTRTLRQIYLDLPRSEIILKRYGRADHPEYRALLHKASAHALMLEASLLVREDRYQEGLLLLEQSAAQMAGPRDLANLIANFKLSLYFPWTNHWLASRRYARSIRAALQACPQAAPQLRIALNDSLSDTYMRAAEFYLRQKQPRVALQAVCFCCWHCPSWRTLKSLTRLLLGVLQRLRRK